MAGLNTHEIAWGAVIDAIVYVIIRLAPKLLAKLAYIIAYATANDAVQAYIKHHFYGKKRHGRARF